MDNGDIESAEEEFPGRIGARKYRPVVANDRAVLQMSSIDPGSSSSSSAAVHQASLQYSLSLSLSRIGFFLLLIWMVCETVNVWWISKQLYNLYFQCFTIFLDGCKANQAEFDREKRRKDCV